MGGERRRVRERRRQRAPVVVCFLACVFWASFSLFGHEALRLTFGRSTADLQTSATEPELGSEVALDVNAPHLNTAQVVLATHKRASKRKKPRTLNLWYTEAHIAPIGDLIVNWKGLPGYDIAIKGKQIGKRCNMVGTCNTTFDPMYESTLGYQRLVRAQDEWITHHYEVWKERLSFVDIFVCSMPPGGCRYFLPFQKPIIVVLAIDWATFIDQTEVIWRPDMAFLIKYRHTFVNNDHDQTVLQMEFGTEVPRIYQLCRYTNITTYEVAAEKKKTLYLLPPDQPTYWLTKCKYINAIAAEQLNSKWKCEGPDIGKPWSEYNKYAALIYSPKTHSEMKFYEAYSMNVPIFAPSLRFLQYQIMYDDMRTSYRYLYMNNRTHPRYQWVMNDRKRLGLDFLSEVFADKAWNCSNITEWTELVDLLDVHNKKHPQPESSFQGKVHGIHEKLSGYYFESDDWWRGLPDGPFARFWWANKTDYIRYPWVVHFDSLKHLVQLLDTMTEADFLAVSDEMKKHNEKLLLHNTKLWTTVFDSLVTEEDQVAKPVWYNTSRLYGNHSMWPLRYPYSQRPFNETGVLSNEPPPGYKLPLPDRQILPEGWASNDLYPLQKVLP